jgi:hypothetical protein
MVGDVSAQFGVETPTGVSYFPESMDVALDSLSNTVTSDLAANNLKQDIAMNSTIGRLVRTERELGLGEGSTVTQGGLGALLGGLLEAQQKTMDGDATSIAAILAEEKLQTGLLEKLGKSMDALAAASPGASWVAMSGALGGKLWQTFASGEEVRVAGRDFLPGMIGPTGFPLCTCPFPPPPLCSVVRWSQPLHRLFWPNANDPHISAHLFLAYSSLTPHRDSWTLLVQVHQ